MCEGEGDLVITDVIMPDENGLDMLPRIKKIRPDLPIVVMSAHSTLLTPVRANASGAYEYTAQAVRPLRPDAGRQTGAGRAAGGGRSRARRG